MAREYLKDDSTPCYGWHDEPRRTTTEVDWWARASMLRGAASRLDQKSNDMKDEAERLRKIAAECQQESERLHSLQQAEA